MFIKRVILTAVVCTLTCAALPAAGVVVLYQASAVYSGFTPQGPGPWVTVQLDDGDGQGTVEMTLSAGDLPGSEFVSDWYLQLRSDLNPQNLVFSTPVKVGSFTAPTISLGHDQFKAGPMGSFDINLAFETAGSGGGSKRFTSGDSLSYTITGIPTLTANSFCETSSQGSQPMAAHVQAISPGNNSGWVTVPEPVSLSLLALGCVLGVRRRAA
jgi:hypothetical protein